MPLKPMSPTARLALSLFAACSPAADSASSAVDTSTSSEPEATDPLPTTAPPTTGDAEPTTPDTTTSGPDSTGAPDSTGGTGETGLQPGPGCGDAIVDPETEACDDGYGVNSDTAHCTLHCALNVCGDGLLYVGMENCDKGANNNDSTYDGCGTDCKPHKFCGDQQVQGPEECDLGPDNGSGNVELGGVACDSTCRYDAKLCFLTSEVFKAYNLGSAEKADNICRAAALVAGYDNATGFMAWVSDDQSSPATRFTPTARPYVMPNGLRVAHSTDDLHISGPITGIVHTDKGEDLLYQRVWTATTKTGALDSPALDCADWTSIDFKDKASVGRSGVDESDLDEFNTWKNQDHWTRFTTFGCDNEFHLYCFEQ